MIDKATLLANIADPWWRICNLYTIVDDYGVEVPFRPNAEQTDLYNNLWHRNIVLKARQLGITTFLAILALDQCIFGKNFTAAIIAHNLPDAQKIFRNKVRKAWEKLPTVIREMYPTTNMSESEIAWKNGSSISVSTSGRSGTMQFLHVSEMGKIAATNPGKATEIVTGSFNAVPADGMIFVESTAEGQGGEFYELCSAAMKRQDQDSVETQLDYRMHFYPWYAKPTYSIDPEGVVIDDNMRRYFDVLLTKHGIKLTPAQKAWYVKTEAIQREKMKREYPSYPKEAFETAIEGGIYEREMTMLRKNGRITQIPLVLGVPVNTFWDFGLNDETAVWFHQRVGKADHFVKYLEAQGEGLRYWWNQCTAYQGDNQFVWGKHFLPHDADARMQGQEAETKAEILATLGMRNIIIVPQVKVLNDGIEVTRQRFGSVWIDEEGCAVGIACLDSYRRKFDTKRGVYSDQPLHNWASNGSDAFRQYGQAYDEISGTRVKPTGSQGNPLAKLYAGRRGAVNARTV